MPTDIPVSNGHFLVNFDDHYRIRDVYFPHIGSENHTKGHPFRFGVWADGTFSWVGPEWDIDLRYRDDSLVTHVTLKHRGLGLLLRCHDAVDCDLNVYIRKVEVEDLEGREREVRLFFCQDFYLYGNEIGDTAYFDPRSDSIIHYKRNRYFLIKCRGEGPNPETSFSCGEKGVPGKEGSWKDAEDGHLQGKPLAWGSADSTLGLKLHVTGGENPTAAYYWMSAGTCYEEVVRTDRTVLEKTPETLIQRTSDYWKAWARKEPRSFGDLPDNVTNIFNRSLLVLRTQIDNGGAIIAANDSDIVRFGRDTYSYMWGRDGAFVAAALATAGYSEICRRFFRFCGRVVSDGGYLFQHYNPDGSLASNWHPWLHEGCEVLPIQEDSTALILWALGIHYEASKDIEFIRPLYEKLILKSADFLVAYCDPETHLPTPSYDLWEERYGVHAYTVATVIAGLRAAARFSNVFQDTSRAHLYETVASRMTLALTEHLYHPGLKRYARSGYRKDGGYALDEVIDISLLGLATLGVLPPDDVRVMETMKAIRQELTLDTPLGGLARYQNDRYQREKDVPEHVAGNPWFICSLWLAEYLIVRAGTLKQLHEAVPYLEWCVKSALPSGVLAEQTHPQTGRPLSVSPLTWSHSAFVWVVLKYVKKYDTLK